MSFLFKKKFWQDAGEGIKSLVTGQKTRRYEARRTELAGKGIKASGKSPFEMDAQELWGSGLQNALAGAAGDTFQKTERGKTMGRVGREIADKVVKPLRALPGGASDVIQNAEKVAMGVLHGPSKMRELAVNEVKSRLTSGALNQVAGMAKPLIQQNKHHILNATGAGVRVAGSAMKRAEPFLTHAGYKAGMDAIHSVGQRVQDATRDVPSMAGGGMVRAPSRRGKLVRLHNKELVVPARKTKAVLRATQKAGIELPLRRR